MNKITIYEVDDWKCVYVNGDGWYQGHSIPLRELTFACPIESLEIKWANEKLTEWVNDHGNFPHILSECLEIEK